MHAFYDRERELEALSARLTAPSSLSLVYGQRRVGKTFLLQHLLHERPRALYFLADESTSTTLLRRFHGEVAASGLGGPAWQHATPSDWSTALTLLVQSASVDGGLTLVLDELQYLIASEPALPSIIQRLWDTFGPRGGLHLILCGSALGTMARLGDEGQPLHGRLGLRMKLRPFTCRDASGFLAGWSRLDVVRAYGVFGGLARHLAEIDATEDLAANTARAILQPLAPLHEAPLDLLRTEHLSSHADANAILTGIASGENRFNAIAARAGLAADRVAHVVDELIALDIVERQRRFGDRPGSRYTRYRCRDPFLTFWFGHVQSNRSALATAGAVPVWRERIVPVLDTHMGYVFEEVVRQAVMGGWLDELPATIDGAAPWWSRDGATEIDLLVRSGEQTFAVECKWRASAEVGVRDLNRFREHVTRCPKAPSNTRLVLATAGSFSSEVRTIASAEGIVLLELGALLP